MNVRDAIPTKIATVTKTPVKKYVNKSVLITGGGEVTVVVALKPSQTVVPRATPSPARPNIGARPIRIFCARNRPAGVTASPNTARLKNGAKSMRLVAQGPPGAKIGCISLDTAGLITLLSKGPGYAPSMNSGTRNAARINSE